MELVNAKKFRKPELPKNISSKILLSATGENTDHEAELFYIAVECIMYKLNKDGISIESTTSVNAFFTFGDGVTLKIDNGSIGEMCRIIVYDLNKMRNLHLNDVQMLTVFTEELIHHFYNDENEKSTKLKTFDAIKYKLPKEVKLGDIYKNLEE